MCFFLVKPKASNKEEEWVEVPSRKNLQKKKRKKAEKTPKKNSSTKSRGRLDAAFKEAVGSRGTVRLLIPRIGVEISDLDPSIGAGDVKEAVRGFFEQELEIELTVSLRKRPYRGSRKAFVLLEEAKALKLLKAAHIKIGWVSCRVRRKKELNRCYRCLGFGHIAADCRGPDRSRCCWRCGEEEHTAGSCTRQL